MPENALKILPADDAETVAAALVASQLDYCNSLLHGISTTSIGKLQHVKNSLARVVCHRRKYVHVTPILVSCKTANRRREPAVRVIGRTTSERDVVF